MLLADGTLPANSDLDDKSIGVFGHFDYQLTDKLSVSLGLRYDDDHKEIKDYFQNMYEEEDYSSLSPKLAAEYKISDQISTYAVVSKGYKSGGFYPSVPVGYPNSYDQETLWNYEIGAKSLWLDDRLMVNGSVYYMPLSDMQVLTSLSSRQGYMSNAASATSMGFEFESNFTINKNVSAFANFGFNETKFDSFKDALGNYDGNYNPHAPKYTYAIGVTFRGLGGFYASANMTGYGKSYLDKVNKYEYGAYELINAKIGYEWENFDFYVYGKNIFDQEYDMVGYGGYYIMLSDPGEFGMRLTWRF